MIRISFAVPLLLAFAFKTDARPGSDTIPLPRPPIYIATGGSPNWSLIIGHNRTSLLVEAPGLDGRAPSLRNYHFPAPVPRHIGEVTIWESTADEQTITIEVRREACRPGAQRPIPDSVRNIPDAVRITLDGQVLEGCGAPPPG
jgi:uncharacterized membrane protein